MLESLIAEYKTRLNWDDPSAPSPWTREQTVDFKNRATNAYEILVKELGPDFEVINQLEKNYLDPTY